ncbi:MAG: glycerol-3-phosphate dehydrogenase/oxidase [Burkholderiaceae bacterium]
MNATDMPRASGAIDAKGAPRQRTAADDRVVLVARLSQIAQYDVLVIGGGATGLGVAVDAANRGLSVALVESDDFAKGTSSRATKMLHGGVRYLAQGDIALVREALRERTTLMKNAPHLAQPIPFLMPVFGARGRLFDKWFYGAGLMAYDVLAGKAGLGKTAFLSKAETKKRMPGVRDDNLTGAVEYWDGQFDDAGLAIALARTASALGACVVNHCAVTGLLHEKQKVAGAVVTDRISGGQHEVRAKCVINATGVWVDSIRRMDRSEASEMVAPSQGVHLVVDSSFLPGKHAMLVPKTADGRVLFAVPWLGKVILGTTDTPRDDITREPNAFPEEIRFILDEAGNYLARKPSASDVRSVWVGLRPLVRPPDDDGDNTKGLSREHTVLVGQSSLVTVTGGKWTTYRVMAQDVLEQCITSGLVQPPRSTSTTNLRLCGTGPGDRHAISDPPGLHLYGSDAETILALDGAGNELAGGLTEAMVRFAARYQYARTVEDVLARRSRLLFLDAAAANAVAHEVGSILRDELGQSFAADTSVAQFRQLAQGYQLAASPAPATAKV